MCLRSSVIDLLQSCCVVCFRSEIELLEGREDDAFRHADKLCQQAHKVHYGGGMSRGFYLKTLEAIAEAEAEADEDEGDEE